MKKMMLTAGIALAIAAVPVTLASAQGFGDKTQLREQDQTHLITQAQARDRDQLHDGTGDRHADCDGTPGDMHRYGDSD